MNASLPPSQPSSPRASRKAIGWIIAGAIALGLLLFLLIWNHDRQQPFFKAGPGGTSGSDADVQVFEPLPAPLPAGEIASSRLPAPGETTTSTEKPRIIETPRPAPARPAPASGAPAASPAPGGGASSAPVAISQPAPRYPREALRIGAQGMVQVVVDVGPDGVPTSTSIASGSGNRDLDRAALDAVRRWRFRPASANGQPTVGRVVVPVQFTLSQ